MRVSELLATQLAESKIVAYRDLQVLMASGDAFSTHGFAIASYLLCSFSFFNPFGIQVGVISALARS
jgi:nucleoside permease NupC